MASTDTLFRIGFVSDKLNVSQGGSNFSLDLIARTLAKRGHEVSILTVNFAHDNDLPVESPYNVVETPLDGESRIGDARGVYQRLVKYEEKFDIYHIFNPALHSIAGAYRRTHDTPVVGRLNTYDIFCTNLAMMDGDCHKKCTTIRKFDHADKKAANNISNFPKYAFDTHALPRLMNSMDRLFALSPQVSRIYQDIGVRESRLHQIPNFYDPSFENDRTETKEFNHERTLLYVGAIKPHKGIDLLVEAVTNLPADVGIEIVGDGPQLDNLTRRATELGLSDRITFHGWVDHDNLAPYYRGADVFVHPGRWPEPFNRTLLEAMQCDCPLVVSDVGAPPWVIDDAGLVFDRGDVEDLSTQLGKLLSGDGLLNQLQSNCKERLETFAPERSVSLIEEQYRELVN